MRKVDAPIARAASTYSFSLIAEYGASEDPGDARPPQYADGNEDVLEPLPQHGDKGDREQYVGKGEEDVGRAHDEAVPDAPVVGGDSAQSPGRSPP